MLTDKLAALESGAPPRREGRALELVMRCFGASGGLLAAGWNSMIGLRRPSQLYCFARAKPRSKGIQVPVGVLPVARDSKEQHHTLVFAVAALDLFMLSLLHFSFQHTSSLGFVEAGNFEDLCRIQPRIGPPSHHGDTLAHPGRVTQ